MKRIDLDECRRVLPMPDLLARLGLGERAKGKSRCPLHEDKNPSFSLFEFNGRYFYKCHTGCGGGDEVKFIESYFNLPGAGEAIRKYGELAGIYMTEGEFISTARQVFPGCKISKGTQANEKRADTAPIEPARLTTLKGAGIDQLAMWRGYDLDFVQWLADTGQIGVYEGAYGKHVAFPVKGGLHYRSKNGEWFYTKGAGPNLFTIGEIEEGACIHVFESQWDALAYADVSGERNNIVATRGAQNSKLIEERFAEESGILVLWPQNDEPGRKWARDIRNALPFVQMRIVTIPSDCKDLNSWTKFGPSRRAEISEGLKNAKEFPPVPVEESPRIEPTRMAAALESIREDLEAMRDE